MKAGLTIIEIIVVIVIMIIALTTALPLYNRLQIAARLSDETSLLIQTLRLARERSLTNCNNNSHGLYFEVNPGGIDRYILYQGATYATRDSNYDRIAILSKGLHFSFTDIVLINGDDVDLHFAAGTGQVNDPGTIRLSHNSGQTSSLVINSLGSVEKN